jgi:hypothetical protein
LGKRFYDFGCGVGKQADSIKVNIAAISKLQALGEQENFAVPRQLA